MIVISIDAQHLSFLDDDFNFFCYYYYYFFDF